MVLDGLFKYKSIKMMRRQTSQVFLLLYFGIIDLSLTSSSLTVFVLLEKHLFIFFCDKDGKQQWLCRLIMVTSDSFLYAIFVP